MRVGHFVNHFIVLSEESCRNLVDQHEPILHTNALRTGHKKKRCMKYGFVLIHQVSTGFFGKYNEMIDEMANTHDLMQACRSLYHEHTDISKERLEELLKSERAVNATTCLNDGIVHLIE
jgi:ATP-dependent protease ClpP protease subunit